MNRIKLERWTWLNEEGFWDYVKECRLVLKGMGSYYKF